MEKVVVHVENNSEYVAVTIHWQGGFTSQHEVVRPVRSYEQLRDLDKLMDRIAAFRDESYHGPDCRRPQPGGVQPAEEAARFLPRPRPPAHGASRLTRSEAQTEQLGPHEWWLPRLAEAIPVTVGKLADWSARGWVRSRRTPEQHLWILWADKAELTRLRKLAASSHRGVVEYPAELITPKRLGHG